MGTLISSLKVFQLTEHGGKGSIKIKVKEISKMIGNIAREALAPLIKWMLQLQPPENLRPVWAELLEGLNARSFAQSALPPGTSGDRLWLESTIYANKGGEIQPIVRMFLNTESLSLSPELARQVAADILLRVRLAEFCQQLATTLEATMPHSRDGVQATIDGFCDWLLQGGGSRLPLSQEKVLASVAGETQPEVSIEAVSQKSEHLSRAGLGLLIEGNFRLYIETLYSPVKAHSVYQVIHLAMLSATDDSCNILTPAEVALLEEGCQDA
jgi:hypothetical protein